MKTINNAVIIIIFLITNQLYVISQNQWQRAIGGPGVDGSISIIQTTDGGYLSAGYTSSFGAGNQDVYIVKLNTAGILQWSRTIGGSGNDFGNSIKQTTDGGYIAVGTTSSFGAGGNDVYIIKLNENGILQWSKTIGGTGHDYGNSIIQTADGGYAVAGSTNTFGAGGGDFYILKLDAGGSIQWSRTIGGEFWDNSYSIIQSADGNYIIAGWGVSFANYGLYIVKINNNGSLLWNSAIPGVELPTRMSAISTSDGGYIMTGSIGDPAFIRIVKFDSAGNLQWNKIIEGTSYEYGYSILQTSDGGYAVAGVISTIGASNFYILKLNNSGTVTQSISVGGPNIERAYSITQSSDGGFVVVGETNSFGAGNYDMYIVKLDSTLNTCSNFTSLSKQSSELSGHSFPAPAITSPASIVNTPTSAAGEGGIVTHVCLPVDIQPTSKKVPSSFNLYQNYPNPFNPNTVIEFAIPENEFVNLSIYDAAGSLITTIINEWKDAGIYSINFDGKYANGGLPSGLYFYQLKAGNYSQTKKMVMLK